MLLRRGKSIPPPGSVNTSGSSGKTLDKASTPASSPDKPPSNKNGSSANLSTRAEALARMTFELNIRRLEAQVNDLQKDMRDVVHATSQDKEFREKNEERLSTLWGEMLAVQQQVSRVDSTQGQSKVDLDSCQRETQDVISELRSEISSLRRLVDGISSQMKNWQPVPSMTQDSGYASLAEDLCTNTTSTQPLSSQESQSFTGNHADEDKRPRPATPTRNPTTSTDRRIEDAIKSTKRWNRDHKSTTLEEAAFCANYLKQQSKRDASLAVCIQKNIGRRLRHRPRRTRCRPSTLEEFCQDVT